MSPFRRKAAAKRKTAKKPARKTAQSKAGKQRPAKRGSSAARPKKAAAAAKRPKRGAAAARSKAAARKKPTAAKKAAKPTKAAARKPAAPKKAAQPKRAAAPKKAAPSKRATAPKKAAQPKPAAAPKKAAQPKPAAAPKKAAQPKPAAAPKKAAKPERAAQTPTRTARRGRPRRARRAPLAAILVRSGGGPLSKLGTKYQCFSCEAKFYDLNRPEPICPKCGANQRDRPKEDAKAVGSPSSRRASVRPMAPLLDDDEGAVREEEIDLGVASKDAAGEDFLDSAVATNAAEEESDDR